MAYNFLSVSHRSVVVRLFKFWKPPANMELILVFAKNILEVLRQVCYNFITSQRLKISISFVVYCFLYLHLFGEGSCNLKKRTENINCETILQINYTLGIWKFSNINVNRRIILGKWKLLTVICLHYFYCEHFCFSHVFQFEISIIYKFTCVYNSNGIECHVTVDYKFENENLNKIWLILSWVSWKVSMISLFLYYITQLFLVLIKYFVKKTGVTWMITFLFVAPFLQEKPLVYEPLSKCQMQYYKTIHWWQLLTIFFAHAWCLARNVYDGFEC